MSSVECDVDSLVVVVDLLFVVVVDDVVVAVVINGPAAHNIIYLERGMLLFTDQAITHVFIHRKRQTGEI